MTVKEAIDFAKTKIIDLRDDLDHERYVEHNDLAANKIEWEIEDWNNIIDILEGNKEDDYNNAKCFLYDKISVLEDWLTTETDKVRKSYIKFDLANFNAVLNCIYNIERVNHEQS